MTALVELEQAIRKAILQSHGGSVNRGDAAEWLTSYPEKTPGMPLPLARYMHGIGLIGAELDRMGVRDKPGNRIGLVSIDVLRAAARTANNVMLLRLMNDALADRSNALNLDAIEASRGSIGQPLPVAHADGGAPIVVPCEGSAQPLSEGWRTVAIFYAVKMQREFKFATAKLLFLALEKTIGKPGSPFQKGEGGNRGKLIVDAFNQPVSLKTIQNAWEEIKEKARSTDP